MKLNVQDPLCEYNMALEIRRTRLIAALCVLIPICALGCAPKTEKVINLDEKIRSHLGRVIAIGVRPVLPDANIETPFMHYRSGPDVVERLSGAGQQALEQAKAGASIGSGGLGNCGHSCALGLALALAATVTGATVGTITGTVSGALAGDVQLDRTVAALVNAAGIPSALQARLVGENDREHFPRLVAVPREATSPYWAAEAQVLGKQEVNSLVDMVISRFVFVESDNAGPHTLSISVNVGVKYVRTFMIYEKQYFSWTDIDTQIWNYQSSPHTLRGWESNDGIILTSELGKFHETMRQRLVKYLGLPIS